MRPLPLRGDGKQNVAELGDGRPPSPPPPEGCCSVWRRVFFHVLFTQRYDGRLQKVSAAVVSVARAATRVCCVLCAAALQLDRLRVAPASCAHAIRCFFFSRSHCRLCPSTHVQQLLGEETRPTISSGHVFSTHKLPVAFLSSLLSY